MTKKSILLSALRVRTGPMAWLCLSFLMCVGSVLAQSEDTRLGAGDVVRVTVFGQNDLETTARITTEGNITFPLVGPVSIIGLTNREASSRIEQRLSDGKFVRNPQVSIFVEERVRAEGEVVTVLGQVKKPGRFAVDAQSNDGAQSIAGVIALAGGIGDDAADYLILSTESGANKIRVDLAALLRDGDLSQNYSLTGGDIILVPTMDVFYVYGEVEKPGRYRLERDTSVMQAISVSGGLTDRGTEKGLSIRRRNAQGDVSSLSINLDGTLQPNDVVVVGESLF